MDAKRFVSHGEGIRFVFEAWALLDARNGTAQSFSGTRRRRRTRQEGTSQILGRAQRLDARRDLGVTAAKSCAKEQLSS